MTIEFIQPYTTNGLIGAEYNRAISNVPADSWVCITDHDTLKPPGFADRVHAVLKTHGRPDRIFGCMTNRVGYKNPVVVRAMYENDSVTDHLEMAKHLWKQNHTQIFEHPIVCGYCMVFHRSLWDGFDGFPDRSITFDKILSGLGKTYIMAGVYIFHLYRWGRTNPEFVTTHLTFPGSYLRK